MTLQEILKLLQLAAEGLVDKRLGDGLMGVFGLGRSAVVDRRLRLSTNCRGLPYFERLL